MHLILLQCKCFHASLLVNQAVMCVLNTILSRFIVIIFDFERTSLATFFFAVDFAICRNDRKMQFLITFMKEIFSPTTFNF